MSVTSDSHVVFLSCFFELLVADRTPAINSPCKTLLNHMMSHRTNLLSPRTHQWNLNDSLPELPSAKQSEERLLLIPDQLHFLWLIELIAGGIWLDLSTAYSLHGEMWLKVRHRPSLNHSRPANPSKLSYLLQVTFLTGKLDMLIWRTNCCLVKSYMLYI